MNKNFGLLLISLCYFSFVRGQNKTELAHRIKVGLFYFYPKNSNESFSIIRNDSVQKEINHNTKDTSIWRIRWQNDTLFNVRYLSGTKKISDAEASFYDAHIIMIKINRINSEYYTFSGGLDVVSGIANTQDTLWFKPKMINN
jgi:hypothetical protein